MSVSYRWPLAISPWTLLDRAHIALWAMLNDRFTMGTKVAELENWFSKYSGGMSAIMVANGSLANQLVFELYRIKHPGVQPVVICPAVTWISSITPQLSLGYEVVFCDIELTTFGLDPDHLVRLLSQYKDRAVIIWPTALLGFPPPMFRYREMAKMHGNALVYLDACEATFSCQMNGASTVTDEQDNGRLVCYSPSILASADFVTTSTFFSHMTSSIEGGFVFCRHHADADLARMFRNHGMVRALPPDHDLRTLIERDNPSVDPRFLFGLPGTNLRPSDVHAMFGLADVKRARKARVHREEMYAIFRHNLDPLKYYLPPPISGHVAFCLPVFVRQETKMLAVKQALEQVGIETRPIVGANLLRQPCFRGYGDPADYPNAEWVHHHGVYCGLHHRVTEHMVRELTEMLNDL